MSIDTFFTRKEYMTNQCTHDQYYSQFATNSAREFMVSQIGMDAIVNSIDEHFNDIPLRKWDNLPNIAPQQLLKKAGESLSQSVMVCIYKSMAKNIRREYSKPRKWVITVHYRDLGASCGLSQFATDISGTVDGITDYYKAGPLNIGNGPNDRMVDVIRIDFKERI